ncbi:tyrosine-type recombinase/integrase [Herbaspirillum sp. GCM10030257]|uniref:tyrosine-type recombinase/integrase n=1 Tax=Herbaspirillum sp. GCM10030257 TaxID=3273393 RepID=UPI003609BF30
MTKLTDRSLKSITADLDGQRIRDDGNLYGRIRAKLGGDVTVSFYYRYRLSNKSKDFSCGTWPKFSLSQIRNNRDQARMLIGRGIDPATQKKVSQEEARAVVASKLAEIKRQQEESRTLQDLFNAWIADGVRRKDCNAELIRSFNADVLPKIGDKYVREITEHDLRRVLRDMVGRGVNRTSVVMRNNLAQMFGWAEKRQPWRKLLIEGNPVDLIEIDKIVSPDYDLNNRRDRVLATDEIKKLNSAFKRMQDEYDASPNRRIALQPVEQTVQHAVWIMLSTLCRVGELSMARWEHVNFETGEWFIPKANVKGNLNDFNVYLSDFAKEHFVKLYALTGASGWCFPARNKEGHVNVKSMSKQIGDRQAMFKVDRDGRPRKAMKNRRHDNSLVLSEGKYGSWTPHDLRRTGATIMQSLAVPLEIIDRCQNHVLSGSKVRRHYLLHEYAKEKRDAWQKLGEKLNIVLRTNFTC